MVRFQQALLAVAVLAAPLFVAASSPVPIYLPDDPIQKMPPPISVGKPFVHKLNQPFDFLKNSARWQPRVPMPAGAVNTLGEPPDSAWYTSRHAMHRMTREQLQRGVPQDDPPQAPFTVVGGKTEGVTPGFRMQDARGRLYFVKIDPMTNPEMATGADMIVSRFMYALGYNVPQNDLVYAWLENFSLSKKAELLTKTVGAGRW